MDWKARVASHKARSESSQQAPLKDCLHLCALFHYSGRGSSLASSSFSIMCVRSVLPQPHTLPHTLFLLSYSLSSSM